MKAAALYERGGKLFIFGQLKTVEGLWIESGKTFIVEGSNIEEIARSVRLSLGFSIENVPHPKQEDWPVMNKAFVESLGVKSFRTFAKNAKCVNIFQKDAKVDLIPTQNKGETGGFVPLANMARQLQLDDENLGDAVLTTLRDCL